MRRLALAALLLAAAAPALAVSPGTKHAIDPKRTGVPFTAVSFPSANDSVMLHGWWFEGAEKSPVLVLCPRGSGTMADLLPSVKEFAARGFAVMTFDLRDFGPGGPGEQDSLKYLVFASRWVDDAQGALRYARAHAPGRFVFAWGQDLGGPLALAVAGRERTTVDAIAVEGLFRTAQEQIAWNGSAQIPEVAKRHRILVDNIDEPSSIVPNLNVPLFVVISGKDTVTPPDVTKSVVAHSLSVIERWPIADAKHDGAELTPGYYDKLAAWFKRIASLLPPPPAAPASP